MTRRYDLLQIQLDVLLAQIDALRTSRRELNQVDLDNWGRLIQLRDRTQGQLNHCAGEM
jgi:hypothetical protein